MVIYGVALLSACLIIGMLVGELLGVLLGVEANVGGVGIAMLLLVLAGNSARFKALVAGASATGIKFWSAMYIPIVVAMAARQNVVAAVEGGMLALLVGVAAVVLSFALVPLISKIGTANSAIVQEPDLSEPPNTLAKPGEDESKPAEQGAD